MRFSTLSSLIITSIAALAHAQEYNTSAPFSLRIVSTNATYNGGYLYGCHEGAAIEGLCFTEQLKTPKTFALNTTGSADFGNLVYDFVYNGGANRLWAGASLTYNIASNVAIPLFSPGAGSNNFRFDANNFLNINSWIDDTDPSGPKPGATASYARWYICRTYAGYSYTTLAWALGSNPPQNPTCASVQVKREF